MQEEVKLNSGERSVRTCIACMENPYVVQRNYGLPWRPSLFTSLCPDNPQTPPPIVKPPTSQLQDPLRPQHQLSPSKTTSSALAPISFSCSLRPIETLEPPRDSDHVYPLKTLQLATPWPGRHLRLKIISFSDTSCPTSPPSSASPPLLITWHAVRFSTSLPLHQ
jgi:hypothetical protein